MTAPAYNDDLTDITTAESGTWVEMASPWNVGDAPAADTDFFIQGAGCYSSDTNNKTGLCSGCINYGSDISSSFSAGDVVLIWHVLLPGNAMNVASNGLRAIIGASTSAFTWWPMGGRDAGRNPQGGWQCYAVDPTNGSGTAVGGGHGGAYQYFGAAADVTSNIAKGKMHGWDAIRYGRGQLIAEYGDLSNGYCTFAGVAQYNDYNDVTNGYNRFGLFQEQQGSYLWKGLLSLGTTSNAVDFRDSNRVIFADDTPNTYAAFNKIEIKNASSNIEWENISITALGTYAPGNLEVVDNATVAMDSCNFQGMGTFIFQSNSDITNTIFKGCALITAGGGTFTGTRVLTSSVAADASAFKWDTNADPDGELDNMEFTIGGNAHHAIELGSNTPSSITLRGWTTSGFNAANGNNDSTIYNNSGKAITINIIGGSGNFSYKNGSGASTSVVVSPVTTRVTVKDADGTVITGARVLVKVTNGVNFPYLATVSITGSGTTATVTHNSHGLATNDNVVISGCNEDVYNGAYKITVSDGNTYTYTTNETITDSPATGTPKSTFAFINGTTDGSGQISDSRVVTNDQPVDGWARKSSSSPFLTRWTMSMEKK
jgi:hypothetical protein